MLNVTGQSKKASERVAHPIKVVLFSACVRVQCLYTYGLWFVYIVQEREVAADEGQQARKSCPELASFFSWHHMV